MKRYMARLFALDGESVSDCHSARVDGVWSEVNDMGSRWIFFPISLVVREGSNKRTGKIVSACDELKHWEGRTCGAFSDALAQASAGSTERIETTRVPELHDLILAL